MRGKTKIRILINILIAICIGTTVSNAAIEIKQGTTKHSKISPSTAYEYCYNMRAYSSSLGANSLDPHLSLSVDWGAVVYLGASSYGFIRSAKGTAVTINDVSYNSTTKNATGVMNLDSATFVSTLTSYGVTATPERVTNLVNNINTKYVEVVENVTKEETLGMAMYETKAWYSSRTFAGNLGTNPVFFRYTASVFGYDVNDAGTSWNQTYRPVIWN